MGVWKTEWLEYIDMLQVNEKEEILPHHQKVYGQEDDDDGSKHLNDRIRNF